MTVRVLHVTPSFFPAFAYGGPAQSVYGLCRHVARPGVHVRVLTTDANGRRARLKVDTCRWTRLGLHLVARYHRRLWCDSVSTALLASLRSAVRWADVVHLTGVYSFPTFPTLWACRAFDKSLVWSPRGSLQRWDRRRRPRLKRAWVSACQWLLPRRTTLHLTSACEARESAGRFVAAERVVIPNGVGVPSTVRRPGGEPRILFLGRLDPIKGIEHLLQAVARTPWRLDIAGDGDPRYVRALRAQAARAGLNRRVSWLGAVGDAEKRRLFAEASVVVVPSHRENFGMVVAEALAHGVPVIASRGTPWERLEERRCGLWVANDPESLAAALLRVRDLPLAAMGERGRAWMKEEFDWPAIAQRMLDLYRDCARSQSAVSATPSARENGNAPATARVGSRS